MQSKKNIPLILGFAIPVLMVIAVSLSVYIPSIGAHPSVNFLYTETKYGSYGPYSSAGYVVAGGKLTKLDVSMTPPPGGNYPVAVASSTADVVRFYIHDTADNTNAEVTFDQAQKLSLDDSSMSADGYEIVYGSNGGFFPFFQADGSDYYNNQYIEGHHAKKKLALMGTGSDRSFQFVGWINK